MRIHEFTTFRACLIYALRTSQQMVESKKAGDISQAPPKVHSWQLVTLWDTTSSILNTFSHLQSKPTKSLECFLVTFPYRISMALLVEKQHPKSDTFAKMRLEILGTKTCK